MSNREWLTCATCNRVLWRGTEKRVNGVDYCPECAIVAKKDRKTQKVAAKGLKDSLTGG